MHHPRIPEELKETLWQIEPEHLPVQHWDVAIVGAGPAGAAAACRLASRGYSVVVLEAYRFPRDKVCGDALLPDALNVLSSLGAWPDIEPNSTHLSAIRVYSPGRFWFDVHGNYVTMPRVVLDTLIARHAARAGATICQAHVTKVVSSANGAHISTTSGATISARYCLLATGSQVTLSQHLGLVEGDAPTALAMRCYVESDVRLDYGLLSYDRVLKPGYAWIFPVGQGIYNVGCGMLLHGRTNAGPLLRKVYQQFITEFPTARELYASGRQVTHLVGAALRCGLEGAGTMADASVCSVGETIGTTLPFTGEGIGTAMTSSLAAADHVDRLLSGDGQPLADYATDMRERFVPLFRGYRAAERWLAAPAVSDFVAKRISKSKFLQDACSGIVNGTVNPTEVYSMRGVLKSLWR